MGEGHGELEGAGRVGMRFLGSFEVGGILGTHEDEGEESGWDDIWDVSE